MKNSRRHRYKIAWTHAATNTRVVPDEIRGWVTADYSLDANSKADMARQLDTRARVQSLLVNFYGAATDPTDPSRLLLQTRGGFLSVRATGHALFCRFADVERAKRAYPHLDFNRYSGKYNTHWFDLYPTAIDNVRVHLVTLGLIPEVGRITPDTRIVQAKGRRQGKCNHRH